MRFNFKIQQYQTDAVESVVHVFDGQPPYCRDKAKYSRDIGKDKAVNKQLSVIEDTELFDQYNDRGFLNQNIELSEEQILHNIRNIQRMNNIKISDSLTQHLGKCSLDVEMETGTGKTYVYVKTMFELNKHYGWNKFIVIVPSIAIREGVKKSFEMTQEHFMEHYGKKARFFVYNSSNLQMLDNFSSSSGINVMIINTQAFAKSLNEDRNVEGRRGDSGARIIYSQRDEFGSRRPIDVISANRPILILDEPQKMGGEVTQRALTKFKPLFSLNYSATHKEHHDLVYVLDALDAYNKRLVKKIEVKGFEVKNLRGTESYMYLENIIVSPQKPPMARIEFEVNHQRSIARETRILKEGDDLYYLSAGINMSPLEQYKEGYVISEIDPVNSTVTFTNDATIHIGDVAGDVSEKDMRRIQIRETIISHFEKEQQLFAKGIKTLSLFFIDEVAKYRQYDDDGNEKPGEYGVMFEQEYMTVLNDYISLFDTPYQQYLRSIDVHDTHRGYFSIDKHGHAVNSTVSRGKDVSDDISAYDLILRNKERLLSFDEPTRFIFSHSALREGWDNPNIFQICTLKHGGDSATQKRQEVGRGLRICVDQQGDRMDSETIGAAVHDINLLTVIASEGYAPFVSALQSDIKENMYERPSKATVEYFTDKTVMVGGRPEIINARQATMIYQYLVRCDYVDADNKVTEKYRAALENKSLAQLPEELQPLTEGVHKLVQSVFDESVLDGMIDNGNETKCQSNPLNDNFNKQAFQKLWGYINHKYAYTVDFDSAELISKAIKAINRELSVAQLQYTLSRGLQNTDIDEEAIENGTAFGITKTSSKTLKHAEISQVRYDLIGKIATATTLTRRTTAAILKGIDIDKFYMFKTNPEEFINKVSRLIKEQKATTIVEHISYDKIEGSYDSTIFTAEKHYQGFAEAFKAQHAIQDYIFTDGTADESVERRFVKDLDTANEVDVYAKLPRGFKIPTPVGDYSPDWAIAFKQGMVKHIYFIAETKGTMDSMNLRLIEQAKISCAKKLFSDISTDNVVYHEVNSYQELLNIMNTL